MEIEKKTNETYTTFGALECGDVFRCDKDYFMKTDSIECAVSLIDGTLIAVELDYDVAKVNAKVIVY